MKIITIASLKGGVGKTTLAAFLSQALTVKGRVLAVDLDANNNLTDYFARDVDADTIDAANSYHLLKREAQPVDVTLRGLFVDVIPGSVALHRLTIEMMNKPAQLMTVRNVFPKEYDYIVIDTAPALDWSTQAGLFAADVVLSPVTMNRWNLQAVSLLREECEQISQATGRPLEVLQCPSIVTEKEGETLRGIPGTWTGSMIRKAGAVRTAANKGAQLKDSLEAWNDFRRIADEIGGA